MTKSCQKIHGTKLAQSGTKADALSGIAYAQLSDTPIACSKHGNASRTCSSMPRSSKSRGIRGCGVAAIARGGSSGTTIAYVKRGSYATAVTQKSRLAHSPG
jgi:hypothetical protein